MPDTNPDSPKEPARGCQAKGGEDSCRLWMSFILEWVMNVILICYLNEIYEVCSWVCPTIDGIKKRNSAWIGYIQLPDHYTTTAGNIPWEGRVVTTSIWFHPCAPIIYPTCITFCLSITSVQCPLSITFVWGALHGLSVYPTLHQEWTLSKHTLRAAVFHVWGTTDPGYWLRITSHLYSWN